MVLRFNLWSHKEACAFSSSQGEMSTSISLAVSLRSEMGKRWHLLPLHQQKWGSAAVQMAGGICRGAWPLHLAKGKAFGMEALTVGG